MQFRKTDGSRGGTYAVNEKWTSVFSGIPEDEAKAQQGVGFLLNQDMARAWRAADSFCEFGGGRLLNIRYKLRNFFFTLVSCCTPTYRCSDAEKERFYSDLGTMLDGVDSRDELTLMGDYNARVGIATGKEEEEEGMEVQGGAVGERGLPEVNDNGLLLLDFCASRHREKLKVASTFFQHKTYGTWYHSSSKNLISWTA